jgi:hypothetical protein
MRSPWRATTGAIVAALALVALPMPAAPALAAPPAAGALKINEDESNGGSPGDFIELINNGASAGDIGGYVIRDNDDTHTYTLPAGTTIAAGGYYVVEIDTVAGGFGLGSADSARLFAPGGTELLDSHSWTAHAATTYGRCPNGTGSFTTTTSSTKGAANDCAVATPDVKINEVESSDLSVADFIEIVNNGAAPAAIGGYVLKDNDDTHAFTIPAGTTIAAGGYYVADVDVAGGFGLGSADSARLFTPGAATLVDSFSWTSHAATTYGRCPDGTGAFATTTASTRGAKNSCPGDVVVSPWPGGSAVATADGVNVFGTNLSGLAYQPSGTRDRGVLWAVRNGPSTLYRLVWDGTKWTPDTANGWSAGKQLRYPNGSGDPDAEGVTLVNNDPANGIFVSTERDNNVGSTSRPAVLRFDASSPATTLNATTDWNLTADLPGLGPNLGAEAIVWIPDSFLVAEGIRDESTGAAYDPGSYANHGSGLFFVGIEQGGAIVADALNQTTGAYSRVATIASGFTGVMDLEFEPETSHLWAVCDDTCSGRSATLDIAQSGVNAGKFVVTNTYERPGGMANLNNEGFAIAPQRECVGGKKPVFWSDDNNTDSHALRSGTLNCTVIVDPQTITFAQPAPIPFGSGPVALVATSTSGLAVSFAASGPCSVGGTAAAPTLVASAAGSCVVTATQAGSAFFHPATPVVRTVTIAKAATSLTQTRVSVLAALFSFRITYAAVLRSQVTGLPLAGRTISFSTTSSSTGPAACTGVTDNAGRATCTTGFVNPLILRDAGTTARFAGTSDYEAVTDTAPLQRA